MEVITKVNSLIIGFSKMNYSKYNCNIQATLWKQILLRSIYQLKFHGRDQKNIMTFSS